MILPAGASLDVDNEIPGMNKARIGRVLRREGIESVRFFNPDGALGYRPDDSYFAEKQVTLARLKNWAMETLSTLDVTSAVRRANDVNITRAEMIPDDKRRWALYIKPENKEGYSVYPDKEDVNRFFSTLKQSMDNIEKVRMELAHKYYALAEVQPDLKVDLFSTEAQDIDLNRIQRVSVFKTKQGETQCVATIDGQKMQPRSVTPQQRQRMMVAEDKTEYKRHLAATLFADVLRKGQTLEENTSEKQEKEVAKQQNKEVTESHAETVSAQRKQWDELKERHPDAMQLIRTGTVYRLYNEDAVRGAEILGLPVEKPASEKGFTASVEFAKELLDTNLPKLVRAGERVAIYDLAAEMEQIVDEQHEAEEEVHKGIHR